MTDRQQKINLFTMIPAEDVIDKLKLALAISGCYPAHVLYQTGVFSHEGPSDVAGELTEYLAD